MSAGNLEQLVRNIHGWGLERNITGEGGATALAQVSKLLEETAECVGTLNKLYCLILPHNEGSRELYASGDEADNLVNSIRDQLADDYGDMLVCIVQAVRLSGLSVEQCLEKAWNDIKDRKGTMVDGKFVKEVPAPVSIAATAISPPKEPECNHSWSKNPCSPSWECNYCGAERS